MDNTYSIHHFRHPHPLSLTKFNRKGRNCGMCRREFGLETRVYGCETCNFFLHKPCAEFQEQIKHRFHPYHTLIYLEESPNIDYCCNVCDDNYRGCIYHCENPECDFDLDLGCAALIPSDKYADRQEAAQKKHQHNLFVCEKPKDFDYYCTRCFEDFQKDDLIYVCLSCSSLLDEACVDQGTEIRQYPFHLEHILTLQPPDIVSSPLCSICSESCDTSIFKCSSCGFNLDLDCANLKPTRTTNHCSPDEAYIQIQPAGHQHPLIQCDGIENFPHSCYGCGLPFHGFIYACLWCGILLHRSCADLPRQISHPLHPQHALSLVENNSTVPPDLFCQVCSKTSGFFIYTCIACEFGLDLKCSWLKFPLIMTEAHQHAVAYMDIKTFKFQCDICDSHCSKFFFRCWECDFNIHDHCYPSLPQTIKHDCHIDPLTFTTTQIKDMPDEDEDAEFYCNACEGRRKLTEPTYYCERCHFVAHVHCLISEIIHSIQRKSAALTSSSSNINLGTSMNDVTDYESPSAGAYAVVKYEELRDKDFDPVLKNLNKEIETIQMKMNRLAVKLAQLEKKRTAFRKYNTSVGRMLIEVGFPKLRM